MSSGTLLLPSELQGLLSALLRLLPLAAPYTLTALVGISPSWCPNVGQVLKPPSLACCVS